MKDFDFVIIGGGCAGLSLAYELETNNKLKNKTLAIIEPRNEYKKDKTWSFWKTFPHNFEDCVKKNWKHFSINVPQKTKHLECNNYPYQSIDSGLFYEKITNKFEKIIRDTIIETDKIIEEKKEKMWNNRFEKTSSFSVVFAIILLDLNKDISS